MEILKGIATHEYYVQPVLCVGSLSFMGLMIYQYLNTEGCEMTSISEILSRTRTDGYTVGFVVMAQITCMYSLCRHGILCYDSIIKYANDSFWTDTFFARLLQSIGLIGTLSYELQYFDGPNNDIQHYLLAGLFFSGSVLVEYKERNGSFVDKFDYVIGSKNEEETTDDKKNGNKEHFWNIFMPVLTLSVAGGNALVMKRQDIFGYCEWGIVGLIALKRGIEGMKNPVI